MECGHVQNVDVVNPEILFRDYLFTTSSSRGLLQHFQQYADEAAARFKLGRESLVIEIGSNDGSLLRFFKEKGMRVLGIDPARSIAHQATVSGLPTIPNFFTTALADEIVAKHGRAALVAANNVFAHADDLADIVRGVHRLLDDQGVFIFEVSYLPDIVDHFLFDTVYHEHVSHHSVVPLQRFFARLGMQLFDVQRIGSKGGSIRGFAQRMPGSRPVTSLVHELAAMEEDRGFGSIEIYRSYGEAIDQRKQAVITFVDDMRREGRRIAGYGASTTVTTLMWHFELQDKIEFLADDNPQKHGLYAPRSHIPVVPSEELYARKPDIVIILAWRYADPILKRHKRFLDAGGTFAVPLPELQLVRDRT